MIHIAPSILAADASRLGEEVSKIENAGATYLHLDIMDGNFVPNISYGPNVIEALRPQSKLIFDVHLMINNPWKYIDRFIKAGADSITVHYEAFNGDDALLCDVLNSIKESKCRVGLAISPKTLYNFLQIFVLTEDTLLLIVLPLFHDESTWQVKTLRLLESPMEIPNELLS